MFFTGLLYLLFEDTVTGESTPASKSPAAISSVGSRIIMGIQVGLLQHIFCELYSDYLYRLGWSSLPCS